MPTKLSWDWKSSPSVEELRRALGPLGVNVYENPTFAGSDSYGFIFSKEPLSKAELRSIGDEGYED